MAKTLATAVAACVVLAASAALVGLIAAGPAAATPAQIIPIGPNAAGGLSDVACSSSSFCLAVTNSRQLAAFVNGTLTTPPSIPGGGFDSVFAVACPSDGTCYAVGAVPSKANPSIGAGAIYTITDGTVANPVQVADVTTLDAITCVAGTTTCTAAGAEGNVGALTPLSGGSAAGPSIQAPGTKLLTGVACPTSTECVGVGSTASFQGVVVADDAGTAGTAQVVSGTSQVRSVDCESATQCWAAAGKFALPISGAGDVGTAVPVAGVSELDGASCPSATVCYLSGTFAASGDTPQQGGTLTITDDGVGAFAPDEGTADLPAIACVSTSECLGGGSEFDGVSNDHEAVFVLDPQSRPAPVVNMVSFLGTGTNVRVVVDGTGFGDWAPAPDPSTPVGCVAGDASFDFDAGVLGFTDTTGGWAAGTAGSCIGLSVQTWSDGEVVLGFGQAYVYPHLAPGDSFTLDILGTTYPGTAAVAATPAPAVTGVAFAVSGSTLAVTVHGSGFGTRRAPADSASPLTCVAGDASFDYPPTLLSLADVTQGWTAGEPGDCLGLKITSWSATSIGLALGKYYRFVTMLAGDSYQLDILGSSATGTATVTGLPTVDAVTFGGTAAKPVLTVTGSDLGPRPTATGTADCGTPAGSQFTGGRLSFADTTGAWTAGGEQDCVGWSIASWTATQATLSFGRAYPSFGTLLAGDSFRLTINGTTFTGTAVLPYAPTVSAVAFSGHGNAGGLTVTVTGTGFGTKPAAVGQPGCVSPDPSRNYPAGVFSFADQSESWTAGQDGDCIGLKVLSWTTTSVAVKFGPAYLQYGPIRPGDAYQLDIDGAAYQSSAPNPL